MLSSSRREDIFKDLKAVMGTAALFTSGATSAATFSVAVAAAPLLFFGHQRKAAAPLFFQSKKRQRFSAVF